MQTLSFLLSLLLPILPAPAVPPPAPATAPAARPGGEQGPQPRLHGPVLGAVTDESALIWARFPSDVPQRVVYSPDPGFQTEISKSEWFVPDSARDHTVLLPLEGLRAETRYYYFLHAAGGSLDWSSPVYHFDSAPPPGGSRSFCFAVFADASSDRETPAQAYVSAAAHQPAFVLQIGDLDHRNPALQGPRPNLESWRSMHRDHLGDFRAGRELTTSLTPYVPLYHIWDDHDYGANNADRTAPWRHLARRAFEEYFPLPPLPNPSGGLWYTVRYA